LEWAIRSSHKTETTILKTFPQAAFWLSGEKEPTFKQLQKFAKSIGIPFGYFFLTEPPELDSMSTEFRTINNKLPDMSKNARDTITAMDLRRSWMSDYRKSLGWNKLEIIEKYQSHKLDNILQDAVLIKELLALEEDWYARLKSRADAFRFLRQVVEDQGILVMQNGVVGSNTHRKLDIEEFRAFMLYDDIAPIIFINNNDSVGGKIFSLVHELIHVLRGEENLFVPRDLFSKGKNERFVNRLTAEVLIPKNYLERMWNPQKDLTAQIQEHANILKVSTVALAIKAKELDCISQQLLDDIVAEAELHFEHKAGEGGDYYRTFHARISPTFTSAIVRSAEAGEIPYTEAYRLLDLGKGKTYDAIRVKEHPQPCNPQTGMLFRF